MNKQLLFFLLFVVCLMHEYAASALTMTEFTPEFRKYKGVMNESIYRNLDKSLPIASPVMIRFFLTSDGSIYDATIEKSSGSELVDFSCLDAVCCSSPLPKPPLMRLDCPSPPTGLLVPPKYYATGVHHFYFEARAGHNLEELFEFQVIPNEVLYRYPNLFSDTELNAPSNKTKLMPTVELIQNCRFQWANFFKTHQNPTKEEVLKWAQLTRTTYLDKKTAAKFY